MMFIGHEFVIGLTVVLELWEETGRIQVVYHWEDGDTWNMSRDTWDEVDELCDEMKFPYFTGYEIDAERQGWADGD